MERKGLQMSGASVLEEIVDILEEGMQKFEGACARHIPFGRSVGQGETIKYIPERCIVNYFSWALINADFAVFNEQILKWKKKLAYPFRLDLLARRFAPAGRGVQIKLEAKGNLDGSYGEILHDLERMENFTVEIPEMKMSNAEMNWDDSRFSHRFNVILTQNWGMRELSDWWVSGDATKPKRHGSELLRKSEKWLTLKKKLNKAKKRGKIPILKSDPEYAPPYTIDILYAIFEDTSVEYKKEVLRKAQEEC